MQLVPKSLAEFAARRRQIKCNPFFAGACTWQKILLSLQVWNLFAMGEQIMRAADCGFLSKKGIALFGQYKPPGGISRRGADSFTSPGTLPGRRRVTGSGWWSSWAAACAPSWGWTAAGCRFQTWRPPRRPPHPRPHRSCGCRPRRSAPDGCTCPSCRSRSCPDPWRPESIDFLSL